MNFSAAGLAMLKHFEGFRPAVYKDAMGFPTIGWGHRLLNPQSFPDGITPEFAETILAIDVRDAEQAVERMVTVPLTQGQFDALVDFVFNLGAMKLGASTLLKQLNLGHYDRAADELLRWDHAGAVELEGLKRRREAEVAMWNGLGTVGPGTEGLSHAGAAGI
jgi:lysozyme